MNRQEFRKKGLNKNINLTELKSLVDMRVKERVSEIKNEGKKEVIESLYAIFFTVLNKEFGFGEKRLQRVSMFLCDLLLEISSGKKNIQELTSELKELGIDINKKA